MVSVASGHSLDGHTESLWLGEGSDLPNDEGLRRSWLESMEQVPAGSVYLHPDMVLASPAHGHGAPIVYARFRRTAGHPDRLDCLAALVDKSVPIPVAPGLSWSFSLRGRRLVGNQLLGNEAEASAQTFVRELAGWLSSGRTGTECVVFEDLEVNSPLRQGVEKVDGKQGVAVFYPSPPQPHWWIEFPDRPDQYWKQLSGETRRNLRKNTNRLKHAVRSFTAVADVPELLEKAHRISRQSWQAKRLGLRVRNDSQEVRLWESIASLGALRSYVLEQDGQPLAFQLALQWKGCLVLEETGYDAAYRNCSPGSVLTFRILEDLIARDTPRLIDFGFGDAPYKGSLCNRQTLSGPVYLVRRSWRPMTVMWLGQIRSTLSQRLRAVFKALRVLSVVRRVYRR